jgi:hypothetical protein
VRQELAAVTPPDAAARAEDGDDAALAQYGRKPAGSSDHIGVGALGEQHGGGMAAEAEADAPLPCVQGEVAVVD